MSLVRWMLETSFGTRNKSTLSVALFMGNKEVAAPGYKRQTVRDWKLADNSAGAVLTFGPYDGPAAYDRYVIFAGEERVDAFMEESTVQMPRGFTWDWKPELILG